jgi:Protein of unknown function (DUF4231)
LEADEYLQTRLEEQINWYDTRSSKCKRWHLATKIVEIICAAIIPLLAGYASGGGKLIAISIGVLGIAVAVCTGISSLHKYQELWIKYRTTAESLKKEKYLFLTKGEPYDSEDALPILVQRVETLVSQENTNWAQYMMKPGKEHGHG